MNFPFTPANSPPWHTSSLHVALPQDVRIQAGSLGPAFTIFSPRAFLLVLVHLTHTPSSSPVPSSGGEVEATGTHVARNHLATIIFCKQQEMDLWFLRASSNSETLCFSNQKALASSNTRKRPPCGLLFCFASLFL